MCVCSCVYFFLTSVTVRNKNLSLFNYCKAIYILFGDIKTLEKVTNTTKYYGFLENKVCRQFKKNCFKNYKSDI